MAMTSDVVIIGAGAIGCAAAYHLAKEKLHAVVVDKGEVGREASWASAGIVSHASSGTSPYAQLCRASRVMFPALAEELRDLTGIDVEFHASGGLDVFFTEEEERELDGYFRAESSRGIAVEKLSAEELLRREPALTPAVRGALYWHEDAQVRTPRYVRALAHAAVRLGATFVLGKPVTEILTVGERVTGVRAHDETISAGATVIAAGAWSGQIGQLLGYPIEVEPCKGQIVLVETLPALLRHVIHAEDLYLVPRADGKLLIGSTVEFVGFDKRPTPEGVRTLLHRALEIVPALAQHTFVTAWAGLRPYRERGVALGPVPGREGVYVASGHYRNGILLSPITGRLIKEFIVDGTVSLNVEKFRL
ncbi:MAG: glycine oxidase ThiO [Abditibacteriales bacterium]|nr:glycine oxidase ThiO [Abditibacteriales bacterium]MDW8367664.1 glycine oxidase ThiO [Abditibacteriales bacterium]